MTATYLACLVPVLVRGKLIHHSNVCVFAGSSYRKLMDHEIIQGKRGGKPNPKQIVRANCTESTTLLPSQLA